MIVEETVERKEVVGLKVAVAVEDVVGPDVEVGVVEDAGDVADDKLHIINDSLCLNLIPFSYKINGSFVGKNFNINFEMK